MAGNGQQVGNEARCATQCRGRSESKWKASGETGQDCRQRAHAVSRGSRARVLGWPWGLRGHQLGPETDRRDQANNARGGLEEMRGCNLHGDQARLGVLELALHVLAKLCGREGVEAARRR
eukprot:15458658-Alexandrium_andersonii.AAC.1